MRRSSLERLCFFIAVVQRGSSLLRTCAFCTRMFLGTGYDRFTELLYECGPLSMALRDVCREEAADDGEPPKHANRSASRQSTK
jgi:hypothetical protein